MCWQRDVEIKRYNRTIPMSKWRRARGLETRRRKIKIARGPEAAELEIKIARELEIKIVRGLEIKIARELEIKIVRELEIRTCLPKSKKKRPNRQHYSMQG